MAQVVVLSESELRVARSLEGNGSVAEIAEALLVSINTVKTHITSLYAKSGKHSRREFVSWFRDVYLCANWRGISNATKERLAPFISTIRSAGMIPSSSLLYSLLAVCADDSGCIDGVPAYLAEELTEFGSGMIWFLIERFRSWGILWQNDSHLYLLQCASLNLARAQAWQSAEPEVQERRAADESRVRAVFEEYWYDDWLYECNSPESQVSGTTLVPC